MVSGGTGLSLAQNRRKHADYFFFLILVVYLSHMYVGFFSSVAFLFFSKSVLVGRGLELQKIEEGKKSEIKWCRTSIVIRVLTMVHFVANKIPRLRIQIAEKLEHHTAD